MFSDDEPPKPSDDVLFFNPDPFVNRMELVMKLSKEYEIVEDGFVKDTMKSAIELTMNTLKGHGNGEPNEVYH